MWLSISFGSTDFSHSISMTSWRVGSDTLTEGVARWDRSLLSTEWPRLGARPCDAEPLLSCGFGSVLFLFSMQLQLHVLEALSGSGVTGGGVEKEEVEVGTGVCCLDRAGGGGDGDMP